MSTNESNRRPNPIDQEIAGFSLKNLPLREPSEQLDGRMMDLFQQGGALSVSPELTVAPVRGRAAVRWQGYWQQVGIAAACLAVGVFLGRISNNLPTTETDEPSVHQLASHHETEQPVSAVDSEIHPLPPTTPIPDEASVPPPKPSHQFATIPRVVSEQLLLIDGVPMKKLHLVSTRQVRVYDEIEKRFVTKMLSKSQFVLTPAPGA